MDRQEAIEQLKNITSVPSMFIDETIKELVEVLEKPPALCDLLGWEEGIEYEELYGDRFIIKDNSLYKTYYANLDIKYEIPRIAEFDWSSGNIEWLRQAKKVEPRPKAWRVRDEYSWNCLIKELEEQGYTKALFFRGYSPVFPIIWIKPDGEYSEAQFGSKRAEMCDIIDYHKELPHIKINTRWEW